MFTPIFSISKKMATALMQMEASRQKIADMTITPRILATLRESARLQSIHYSTMIEGNRLTEEEVKQVIIASYRIPEKARDEKEVLGYYAALEWVEEVAKKNVPITEEIIQKIHALVLGGGKKRVKLSSYRIGQNVIRDTLSKRIVYMPPEAKDVNSLMQELIEWIEIEIKNDLPPPLISGVAHYQFATIHPYYDGNGRSARLLTTLIMHRLGYDLKGIYSLDEYYAEDLLSYYDALTIGPSHNYYMGRKEADITKWVEYFCLGAAHSFETIKKHLLKTFENPSLKKAHLLSELDPRQKKVFTLFYNQEEISSKEVSSLLRLKKRTASFLIKNWVDNGFLEITQPSKKLRKYCLAKKYQALIFS